MLRTISKPLVRMAERYIPNALFFAIALTLLVAILSLTMTTIGPVDLALAWGDGLAGLLAFMTQMALVLLLGYTLAHTGPVQKFLAKAAEIPRSPAVAYGFVTFITGSLSLINWGLGLIAGGIMAVEVAKAARRRGMRLHYPLLVAAAYSGWVIFHMGYSGSAPLAAATAGGLYEDVPGGVVDVSRTIFAPWNMIAAVVTLIIVTLAMARLAPKGDDPIVEAPDALFAETGDRGAATPGTGLGTPGTGLESAESAVTDGPPAGQRPAPGGEAVSVLATPGGETIVTAPVRRTPAEVLDQWRGVTLFLGVALGLYVVTHFATRGFLLTFDIVNWTFMSLTFLLVGNIRELVGLVGRGGRTVGDILIQYPLYAGIIGMMSVSGLAGMLSDFFVNIATPETLGVWAFLSAGFLNMFIPSGGGQFAVQAPIFSQAADTLGVDQAVVIMAIAYGDQWTNMIQPFWAIPLLAIAGLKVREIMGYTTITLVVSGAVFATTLLLVGAR